MKNKKGTGKIVVDLYMIKLSAFSDEAGKSLPTQINSLLKNNIYLTELRSVDGKNVKNFTLEEGKQVHKALKENGISLSALGSPMGKVDISVDFDEYMREVHHLCRLANVLETERIRMFSFYGAYGDREAVIERLVKMVNVAKSYGITLCHENEKGIYGDTTERILDLLNSVSGLKFVYDPANFLQVGEMPHKTIPALLDKSLYFHVKDVVHQTGELVPAGVGDGNIERILQIIVSKNVNTVLTLEPHLKIFEGYNEIDGEEMKHRFNFVSGEEAFDAAVLYLKRLLIKCGCREVKGGFEVE